jgi:branched-chain amino acid aminotransferase
VRAPGFDAPAVTHGIGLFETILVDRGRPIHIGEHYARMARSCGVLRLPLPDEGAFHASVTRVCSDEEHAVRCLWVAAGSDLGDPAAWALNASAQPIPRATLARREQGRAITLAAEWSRSMPEHKTTSYLVCTLALRQAMAAGADEALFVGLDRGYLEGTATNLFAVRGTTLVTAPGVLPGIVRGWVLAQAPRLGLTVEERTPSRREILGGAFLTGSLTKRAPVRQLDGQTCAPPGDPFADLAAAYERELVGR